MLGEAITLFLILGVTFWLGLEIGYQYKKAGKRRIWREGRRNV